jgi:hypothetical protein
MAKNIQTSLKSISRKNGKLCISTEKKNCEQDKNPIEFSKTKVYSLKFSIE